MESLSPEARADLRQIVDEYRHRCLWFLKPDFDPTTSAEARRVLDAIQRHRDRDGFQSAARTREWLSPPSSATSVGSQPRTAFVAVRATLRRGRPIGRLSEELGLTLHPFDLATGKVLALVGRVEPRDFVDTLTCDSELQPLGYLAWAACGKDPGFSPGSILELATRAARYTDVVLRLDGSLYWGGPGSLSDALAGGELVFHEGAIRGALLQITG